MTHQYFENTGDAPIFVGGKMIPAGAGRDIPIALLPPELRKPAAAPEVPSEPSLLEQVEGVRKQSVKLITEQLPGMSSESLDMLLELENQQANPRKGVADAVAAERIRRADEALQTRADQMTQAQLDALTPEQRDALGNVANP